MSDTSKPYRKIERIRVPLDDNDVGYGKPPKAHQFKPGRSGNPKGRPKGTKSEQAILTELLDRKINLRRDNGKARTITVREGIYHKLVEDSLRGNIKSAAFLFHRLAAIAPRAVEEAEMTPDDKAVLDAYLQTFLSEYNRQES